MIVWLSCYPGEMLVLCPAVSEDGGTEAMLRKVVRPGQNFYGYGYEELRRLGDGKHVLEDRPRPAAKAGG